MVLEIGYHLLTQGPPQWVRDNAWLIVKTLTTLAAIALVKLWSNGASCPSERNMHGKVVMVTGGTSGIGASAVFQLAKRGAQVILLTQAPVSDPFLADYINDVRARANNQMVYAEQVDLSSLHSIRQFATKWIDNAPPRRLDMVILNAATITPPGKPRQETDEGVEETWMINYLANFHLLGILSPALRAQPFDRDVRVIVSTCSSYIGAPPLGTALDKKSWSPSTAYQRSKLALMCFGLAFQRHLDAYERPDKLPMNARVLFVDPGFCRTPGMRRWLTRGSLWGLLIYLAGYFWSWLLLKSPDKGSQSILYAAMEASLERGPGGRLIKECREVDFARKDVDDESVAKKLWSDSDKLVERVEKEQAKKRAKENPTSKEEAPKKSQKDGKAKDEKSEKKKGKKQQQQEQQQKQPKKAAATPQSEMLDEQAARGQGPQVSDDVAEQRLQLLEGIIENAEKGQRTSS